MWNADIILKETNNFPKETSYLAEGCYAVSVGAEFTVKVFSENVTPTKCKEAPQN